MSIEKSDYYTYGLANPLKSSKDSYIGGNSLYEYEYFYFGYSGDEKRLDHHLKCRKSDKNYHKKDTIKKIRKNDSEPIFIKILENVNKQTAIDKEIEMIAYYGRDDLDLGPLTNKTNGGDGGATRTREDLTNQKFNRWTVIKFIGVTKNRQSNWLCKCVCGIKKEILSHNLKNGKSKSCGCLREESTAKKMTTHGKSYTPEYRILGTIKWKCYNENSPYYKDYEGIIICERWLESFENFYGDMGERPSDKHILSRKDKNGNFEPNNCEWKAR